MKSITERTPLQQSRSTTEPLHVFTDRSRSGVELHVYADHLELHSGRGEAGAALWYRHVRAVAACRENGNEVPAIIDRGGQVLVVPMAHEHLTQGQWLISNLMEAAERSRG
jgi:hypothetical protein